MSGDRRGTAQQRPEEDPRGEPVPRHGVRGVVLEGRLGEPRGRRERHPQLHSVQHGGAGRAHLGVGDSPAGGHQVQLARPDQGVVSRAVAVLDLAGEQPAHRLQLGVRVRRYGHAAGPRDRIGPVVIDEAPAADQRTLPLRQRAPDVHGARTAQRDLARQQDLDGRPGRGPAGRGFRGYFLGPGIEVAHARRRPTWCPATLT
jgi:hypothetical protein